jgi:hypothetical protein
VKPSLAGLGVRDRRALLGLTLALVIYAAIVGVRSYAVGWGDAREELDVQRELLARELGLLEAERAIDGRLQRVAASFASRSEAMFTAADSLAAVSDLSALLLDLAAQSRVHVEHVESRSSSAETAGVVTLMVILRGRSDLEGLLDFTGALGEAANLIRVEQLSITRLPTSEPRGMEEDSIVPDVQVLEFSALVTGYALPDESPGPDGERG